MELRDYLAALRRHWRAAAATLGLCLAAAATAYAVTPATYSATAGVFVSASASIPNSAQYVVQRAKSYPDVAESGTVLEPVIRRLGLTASEAELRSQVTASNPTDTSQVEITVTSTDPEQAATLANAVARELVDALPDLEKHAPGDAPVELTVTDPAGVPTAPVSPKATQLLGLGLVVGLLLGAAVAVVRSRRDTAVHDEADVRALLGGDVEVLSPARGRAARSTLTGRPARSLARRLELELAEGAGRVAVVCPAPSEPAAAVAVASQVAAELVRAGVAAVADRRGSTSGSSLLRMTVVDPLLPARAWREDGYRGAVLVVPAGRVDAAELRELGRTLEGVDVPALAVVLVPPRRRTGQTLRGLGRRLGGVVRRTPSTTAAGATA